MLGVAVPPERDSDPLRHAASERLLAAARARGRWRAETRWATAEDRQWLTNLYSEKEIRGFERAGEGRTLMLSRR